MKRIALSIVVAAAACGVEAPGEAVRTRAAESHPSRCSHHPTMLAAVDTFAGQLTYDDHYVYWTQGYYGGRGAVLRVSKHAGDAETLAGGLEWTPYLALADGTLFFAHQDDPSGSQLLTVDAAGGDVATLVGFDGNGPSVGSLATSTNSVIFVKHAYPHDTVMLYDLPSDTTRAVAGDENGAADLQADDQFAYWRTATTLRRAPLFGKSLPVTLVADAAPWFLTSDGTTLYYIDVTLAMSGYRYSVRKVSKLGGEPVTLFSTTETSAEPTVLATDGERVYWPDHAGRVRSISVDGGDVTDVVATSSTVARVLVDDHAVYWYATYPEASLSCIQK